MILYGHIERLNVESQVKLIDYYNSSLSISGHIERQIIFDNFSSYFRSSAKNAPELRRKCFDILIEADNQCQDLHASFASGHGSPAPGFRGYYEDDLKCYASDNDITEYEYLKLRSFIMKRFESVAINQFEPDNGGNFEINPEWEYSGYFELAEAFVSNKKVPMHIIGQVLCSLFERVKAENQEYIKLMRHPIDIVFFNAKDDPRKNEYAGSEVCNKFSSLIASFIRIESESKVACNYKKELLLHWITEFQGLEFRLPAIENTLRKYFLLASQINPSEPKQLISAERSQTDDEHISVMSESLHKAYNENLSLIGVKEVYLYRKGHPQSDDFSNESLFLSCCHAFVNAHKKLDNMPLDNVYYVSAEFDSEIDDISDENMCPTLLMAYDIEHILKSTMPKKIDSDSPYEVGLMHLFEASGKHDAIQNYIDEHIDDLIVSNDFILKIVESGFSLKHSRNLINNLSVANEDFLLKLIALCEKKEVKSITTNKKRFSSNVWIPLREAYNMLTSLHYYPALLNGINVEQKGLGKLLLHLVERNDFSLLHVKLIAMADFQAVFNSVRDELLERLPGCPKANEWIASELLRCKTDSSAHNIVLAGSTRRKPL